MFSIPPALSYFPPVGIIHPTAIDAFGQDHTPAVAVAREGRRDTQEVSMTLVNPAILDQPGEMQ